MSEETKSSGQTVRERNVMDLLKEASRGGEAMVDRMPRPTLRTQVPMRDSVTLDTWIWLPPTGEGPFPTILMRTPYEEHVMGWRRLGTLRYRDAGYAVVHQLIRGVGGSGGVFTSNSPSDRTDGYDTIEWIARQPWSSGRVGMDGSSYAGMTQLTAAAARPPALKCIAPAVPSVDFFNHTPRMGGAFSRQHTLGWPQFITVQALSELTPGLWGEAAFLSSPAAWRRLLMRPACDAVEGVLQEDRRQHYLDVLSHGTFDDWWRARTLSDEDFAAIDIPVLIITGAFDGSMGSQYLWRKLEDHAPRGQERWLVVGPWDHGQAYVGGRGIGPWRAPAERADLDPYDTKLAFFERHLKEAGTPAPLPGRVSMYMLGADQWIVADRYPPSNVRTEALFLHSDGLANLRGRGLLTPDSPTSMEAHDSFQADPEVPFVAVGANLDPDLLFDLRERERQEDTLVYSTGPIDRTLRLLGEFTVDLFVASDTPDCDVVCWLATVAPGGSPKRISQGIRRLRYRNGYSSEQLLEPGEPVRVRVEMDYVAHEVPPGFELRLMIAGSLFPLIDPNPNTGEPILTAATTRVATQSIFHDTSRPSCVLLPVLCDQPDGVLATKGPAQ